jgi:large subunit ribosomal protein L25
LDRIELDAQTRTAIGNGPARALRRDGRVPAILYGPGSEPSMLSVSTHELSTIISHGSLGRSIINLRIDGGKAQKIAMIKELQTHPVSHAPLHLDLYEIAMDRKIRVNVPITTTGTSVGVEKGGLLQIVRRDLEVLCLPNEIPDVITIDIRDLDIGDAVHVEDLKTGGQVEIPHDTNFTVLTVTSPRTEGAEEGEEAAAAGMGAAEGEGEE